ncbi:sensor histidine kinase [Saccharophagus degradans]|uniref:histidine kinase n=1 Tax=Saccharophagus degradans (strain 2-40 / ATCC 43961 / DSM 17024) TaxID=203122 RepID=Q21E15_SACD2|nr:ATP-binding protein [Saccharophagus degradans]ABD83064.1 ATP-binding region, ATPase-like protein [Saccharophagus degradans 2-40]
MLLPLVKELTSPKLVENKRLLFFLFFLALSAVVLTSWQSIAYLTGKNQRFQLLRQATMLELQRLESRAAERLAISAIALSIVAQSPTLSNYANQTSEQNEKVSALFDSLIKACPDVFQIRFLDKNGNEKIRFERNNGSIFQTDSENLQSKKNRRYFQHASKLAAGQMYVSPLELNMEYGEVELPWRPTIRLAMPVYPSQGNFEGVIVININAQVLLNFYKNSSQKVKLLSPDGHYILGEQSPNLWGFMFNKPAPFPIQEKAKWQSLLNHTQLDTVINDEHWAARRTHVNTVMPATLTYSNTQQVLWYAVVNEDNNTPTREPFAFIPIVVTICLLSVLSWVWTSSINQKRRTEQELARSEKMASLGGLVAGVAHELNTPLGSAVTIASTIQEKTNAINSSLATGSINKSTIVEFVQDMEHASKLLLSGLHRAAELIGQFKLIAVDQTGEQRRSFQLDIYLADLSATLAHQFKHRKVDLLLDFKSNAEMHTYPGALSQVVINLITNTLTHAFAEGDVGEVILYSREASTDHVCIGVIDNGVGISEENISKIFEPFFTTKLGQGGSGLGLHITFNIVTNILGGKISVTSNQAERRTEFIVTIPKHFSNSVTNDNN